MGTKVLYLDAEGRKAMFVAIEAQVVLRNKMPVLEARSMCGKVYVFSGAQNDIENAPEALAKQSLLDMTTGYSYIETREDSLHGRMQTAVSDILNSRR